MSAEDFARWHELADSVIAVVRERRSVGGSTLFARVTVIWRMRPRIPLRPVFNQVFAAMCFWMAGWGPFEPSSRMVELLGRCAVAAFGAVLSYAGLVEFFNRTTMVLENDRLSVTQGPLPWFGRATISIASISAVRTAPVGDEEPGYAVCVVTGLKQYRFFRLPRDDAQRVASFLEQAFDQLERGHLQTHPRPPETARNCPHHGSFDESDDAPGCPVCHGGLDLLLKQGDAESGVSVELCLSSFVSRPAARPSRT